MPKTANNIFESYWRLTLIWVVGVGRGGKPPFLDFHNNSEMVKAVKLASWRNFSRSLRDTHAKCGITYSLQSPNIEQYSDGSIFNL